MHGSHRTVRAQRAPGPAPSIRVYCTAEGGCDHRVAVRIDRDERPLCPAHRSDDPTVVSLEQHRRTRVVAQGGDLVVLTTGAQA